jgi:acyl-coenzyme A synthetase/AMP-(fatty) acid ligase
MESELQQMAVAVLGRDPEEPAIEYDGRWYDRRELRAVANAITGLLDASGAREDGPVGLLARNRPWAIAALLALLSRGRNIQMIYTFQSEAGIARDLLERAPAVLIAEAGDFSEPVLAALAEIGAAAIALEGMTARPVAPFATAAAGAERTGPSQRQVEIFTSGTTGKPKRFSLPQAMIARHIVSASRMFADDAGAGPPQLLYFPLGNISGIYAIFPTILRGQPAILIDRFSIEAWRRYVVRYRPAFSGIPPSFYQVVLDMEIPREDLASIKFMGAGAAPLDSRVQATFEERYGIPILNSYGATEFGGPVTAMTLGDRAKYGPAKLGSVGKALPGVRLKVVGEPGDELPAGQEGLLEVVSPRLGPEWIRTSDLAVIDSDGFVYLRGRADGAIVRGGFKILPETIEAALKAHPAISEVVVVGVPDRRLGQAPAAAIRLKQGATQPSAAELEAHLRERVMNTHIPTRWRFCEELPRTISAKLDRRAVAELFTAD